MFGFESWAQIGEANDQIEDAALATAFNVLAELCGPDWNAIEVRFAHRKPQDLRPFREFFRAPLLFDDERNAVVFHSNWLRHPLRQDDPEVRRLVESHVGSLEIEHGDDFAGQVRSILRTALLTDHAHAEQIALLLSMHTRTLHRRLAASGTSFRQLVDETRFAIARQILEDTNTDIGVITNLLNYADTSAFTRAFRRWSGKTPGAWRREHPPQSGQVPLTHR
jgi:AraC-like DNA-binding protein